MDTEYVREMVRGYGVAGQTIPSVQTHMTYLWMLQRNRYWQYIILDGEISFGEFPLFSTFV